MQINIIISRRLTHNSLSISPVSVLQSRKQFSKIGTRTEIMRRKIDYTSKTKLDKSFQFDTLNLPRINSLVNFKGKMINFEK